MFCLTIAAAETGSLDLDLSVARWWSTKRAMFDAKVLGAVENGAGVGGGRRDHG